MEASREIAAFLVHRRLRKGGWQCRASSITIHSTARWGWKRITPWTRRSGGTTGGSSPPFWHWLAWTRGSCWAGGEVLG